MHPVHNQKPNHRFWSVCNQLICLSVKILSKQNRLILYLPVAFFEILRSHNFRHLKLLNTIPKPQCLCHRLSRYHHQNFLNQRFIIWYYFNYQKERFLPSKTCEENHDMCSPLLFVSVLLNGWFWNDFKIQDINLLFRCIIVFVSNLSSVNSRWTIQREKTFLYYSIGFKSFKMLTWKFGPSNRSEKNFMSNLLRFFVS